MSDRYLPTNSVSSHDPAQPPRPYSTIGNLPTLVPVEQHAHRRLPPQSEEAFIKNAKPKKYSWEVLKVDYLYPIAPVPPEPYLELMMKHKIIILKGRREDEGCLLSWGRGLTFGPSYEIKPHAFANVGYVAFIPTSYFDDWKYACLVIKHAKNLKYCEILLTRCLFRHRSREECPREWYTQMQACSFQEGGVAQRSIWYNLGVLLYTCGMKEDVTLLVKQPYSQGLVLPRSKEQLEKKLNFKLGGPDVIPQHRAFEKSTGVRTFQIQSCTLLSPAVFPVTLDLLRRSTVSHLSFNNVFNYECPEEWSFILEEIKRLPWLFVSLTHFDLTNDAVPFQDLCRFLKHHSFITHLRLSGLDTSHVSKDISSRLRLMDDDQVLPQIKHMYASAEHLAFLLRDVHQPAMLVHSIRIIEIDSGSRNKNVEIPAEGRNFEHQDRLFGLISNTSRPILDLGITLRIKSFTDTGLMDWLLKVIQQEDGTIRHHSMKAVKRLEVWGCDFSAYLEDKHRANVENYLRRYRIMPPSCPCACPECSLCYFFSCKLHDQCEVVMNASLEPKQLGLGCRHLGRSSGWHT